MMPFLSNLGLHNGSHKEGWWEEGPLCHQWGSDQGYTIDIHKHIHGVGFKKRAPRALREIWKLAIEEMGTPDVSIDTGLNKAI